MQRPRVLASLAGSAVALHVVKRSSVCGRPRASSSPRCCRSLRRRSLSAAGSSPATTAPSTSRSARTSTASRGRRSTSGAARTWSARCCSPPPLGNLVAERAPRRLRNAARAVARARCRRRFRRDVRVDDAQPVASRRAPAREARPRAAAPLRDARADGSAARGRRGRAGGVSGARVVITTRARLDPGVFDLPVEKMRAGWYTDAYFNHTRAALLEDGRHPQRGHAGLPEEERVSRRHGRGDRDPQALRRRLRRS